MLFRSVQAVYMPQVATLLSDNAENDFPSTVETAVLYLPNQIPSNNRSFDTTHNLSTIEAQLRFGEATDALVELRQSLCVKAHLVKYKHDQVRGQRPNTRARALVDRAQTRVEMIAESYRAARQAYLQLVGPGPWENTLRVLRPQDIRAMVDADDSTGSGASLGEGYRSLSWIWMSPDVTTTSGIDPHEMHDGTCPDVLYIDILMHSFCI